VAQACNSSFRAKAHLCGYLLIFAGVIAAYFALTRVWERMEIARSYQRAEGVVVGQEVRERMVRSAKMMVRKEYYYPIVEYRTENGVFTITGEVSAEEPLHEEGQRVPILYPSNHPGRGLIADFSEMYFVATFRGALALLLFLAAGAAFVVPKMMDDPLAPRFAKADPVWPVLPFPARSDCPR
jgi:hypothetical protein